MSLMCFALVLPLQACASGTDSTLKQNGTFKITSIATGTGAPVTNVVGEIVLGEDLSQCLTLAGGSCTAVACSVPPPFALDNSGTPLVVSSSAGMFQVPLTDEDEYSGSSPVALWSAAGQSVTLTAPGSDVPGFSVTVLSPPNLVLTAPDVTSMPMIPLANDFKLTWTPIQDTTLHSLATLFWSQPGGYTTAEVDCDFTLSDGEGTIPQSLLTIFQTGEIGHLTVAPAVVRNASIGSGWGIAVETLSQTQGTGNMDITSGVDVTFQ